MISSEDSRVAERLTGLLADLAFQVEQFRIPTGGAWQPNGDVVAICGQKLSHVTAEAIESDPHLTFEPDEDGQWTIRERDSSRVYGSPMGDAGSPWWTDVAYVGRIALGERTLLVSSRAFTPSDRWADAIAAIGWVGRSWSFWWD